MKELGFIYFAALGIGLLLSVTFYMTNKMQKKNVDLCEAEIQERENRNSDIVLKFGVLTSLYMKGLEVRTVHLIRKKVKGITNEDFSVKENKIRSKLSVDEFLMQNLELQKVFEEIYRSSHRNFVFFLEEKITFTQLLGAQYLPNKNTQLKKKIISNKIVPIDLSTHINRRKSIGDFSKRDSEFLGFILTKKIEISSILKLKLKKWIFS
jgi:hypothetical protein